MPRYLIKQWTLHRGFTRENPSCYFYGSYIYHHPLTAVRADMCYTSRSRAERYAAKCYSIYSPTEVIEVPDELIVKEVR